MNSTVKTDGEREGAAQRTSENARREQEKLAGKANDSQKLFKAV